MSLGIATARYVASAMIKHTDFIGNDHSKREDKVPMPVDVRIATANPHFNAFDR
jgi:hypothetical protein